MTFIAYFARIQILFFFYEVNASGSSSGSHRLSSEESTLAFFVRPESDLKAKKTEKTAVALGEHWQVATTTLWGKIVLCISCVRAASLKVTISQDRISHLPRD